MKQAFHTFEKMCVITGWRSRLSLYADGRVWTI